jgi:hypothetical protein
MKTGKLSASFTLAKASQKNGVNIEHNNRLFVASNVDSSRIADNVTYVQEDIRIAYAELFSGSLKEYNEKQKRKDRKIDDYYGHILSGNREETCYEIVVQFGDCNNAPVGSELGETASILLGEYMRGFGTRNPNLYVFNAADAKHRRKQRCSMKHRVFRQ